MRSKGYQGNQAREPTIWDLSNGRIEAHINAVQSPRANPELIFHKHPHFELLYIIEGARAFEMNGVCYTGKAGDLLVFRPDDVHMEYAGSHTASFFVFRFRADELADTRMEFPKLDAIGPVIPLPQKEEIYELFNRMLAEQNHRGDRSQLLLGAYLVEFIIKLHRAINHRLSPQADSGQDPIQIRIRSALDLIHKNISCSLDLKKIARSAFMSVPHFAKIFKERTGENPKHYLIRARIEKAKNMLIETDKTASEIAGLLGYESPYYFYRQFRKITGMTAGRYRSQHRRLSKKVHRKT